jgi:outer membrane protein
MRRFMKSLTLVGALLAMLGPPGEARAQFANHSLGLEVGYLSLNGVEGELSYGVPFAISGSLYVENGFEVVAHIGGMVAHDDPARSNIFVLDGPSLGVRYLFLEERLRPFIGLDLTYLQLFGTTSQANTAFGGLGPNAGVYFFVTDSLSIGLRMRFNLYLSLNEVWNSFGLSLNASTYF